LVPCGIRDLLVVGEKVLNEVQRKIFHSFDGVLAGDGIDGILHRVGGQDFLVFAFCVGGFEVAFKANADGELFDVVAAFLAHHTE
jgi:hypothetical protein